MVTPTNRKVIDISHWNTVTSWSSIKAAGVIGVIHKATEGAVYKDANYLQRATPAYKNGFLWGAYHFGDNSNVQHQVANFLGVVGVDNDTLYALDWEDEANGSTMSAVQAKQFIQLVEAQIGGNRVVLYSGNTAKEALGATEDMFFGAHRLWLAQYGSDPIIQASWDKSWLWQYSDGRAGPGPHGCPGVSGLVDTNSWPGTDDELRAQWVGPVSTAPVQPVPQAATVSITTAGDVQVIVNGQLVQITGRQG